MSNVTVLDHPLIQHKVGVIRRKEVGSKDFRAIIGEIAMLMCYEATRDLKLVDVDNAYLHLRYDSKGIKRKEAGSGADLKSRPWHGRWHAGHDPGGKGGTYRTVS